MRRTILLYAALPCLLSVVACSDDDPAAGSSSGAPSPSPPAAGAGALETAIASCPAQSTLIETADWTSCLSGKTLSGKEVFGDQACGLRFEADGALTYLRAGAVAIATPARAGWKTASGTYQNDGAGARRIFLASVSPSLEAIEGQPRVTTISVKVLGSQANADSTVEVAYLDASLARQTYNCKLTP